MPILLLGLVFAIGLFIYYLFSTSVSSGQDEDFSSEFEEGDDTLKKEENVIFLPDDIEEMKKKHREKKR